MYIGFAIALFLAALALLWWSNRQRRGLGLPEGRIFYSDTGIEREITEPLFAEDLSLVGRPDYLVETKQGLIPVEVKSGRTPSQPFQSHIYQLAAYCALVECNFGKRPAYGIIRYPGKSFQVDFTRQLESQLIRLLDEMKQGLMSREMHRSHRQPARCRSCGYLQVCEESL
ncbi:MAG: CRISPR-associated protein Cas4 [Anaerolineales bacterium]